MARLVVHEAVEHKFFVCSRMNRDSFEIKNYLDNSVKRGLPLDGDNGIYTYDGSNPQFVFDLFEFEAIEDYENRFHVKYMKIIMSESEISLEEQIDQVTPNDNLIEYHGIFKIDSGNQFVRVKLIGEFESAADRLNREIQDWMEVEEEHEDEE